MNNYYVYIMTTKTNNVLYIGVTNDLERRVKEHKQSIDKDGFTARYKVNKLVYAENCGDVKDAIAREKQLKKWNRNKKFALIKINNPEFRDLSDE